MSLQPDGSSRLELADDTGRPRAILGADARGTPGLLLVDHQGRARASLEVSPRGEPSLVLEGERGAVFRAPAPVQ